MKKIILSAIVIVMVLSGCNGQKKDNLMASVLTKNDSINRPKTNIKVNRKYDENGNLISYDSTYTYSYSNTNGENIDIDSLFNQLGFNQKGFHSFPNHSFPNSLLGNDSLMLNDPFFNDELLSNNMRKNLEMMERMMQHMDSINSLYIQPQHQKQKNKFGNTSTIL